MATSTIPAAIDAFVAALRGSAGLSGVDVFDGEPTTGENPDYVCIGHDPTDPLTTAEGGQVPASLGNRAREESYEIVGSLAAWSGDEAMSARRARAMVLFAAVESTLRDNITLGGTVRSAQIASYSLLQQQTDRGSMAGVRFRIVCSARLT